MEKRIISIESALDQILEKMKPLPVQSSDLLGALGCVLGEAILAPEPLPPFTNSAMDGYAVRASDCGEGQKVLRVIEELPAGTFPQRPIEPRMAAKIMTGAALPPGADAVVPVEETEILSKDLIRIHVPVRRGQHVRPQGEEVQPGERLFAKGCVLKPADLGLLASLGYTQVSIIPRPRVSVITTGSEVVDPGTKPKPGQIRNANLTAIIASATLAGAQVVQAQHVADEPERLASVLSSCPGDILITCGGVSVGDYDFVKAILSNLGEIYFWKVAIKPGKPFVFGRVGQAWLFGLPGNPVSSLVAFEVFVRPALRALAGHEAKTPVLQEARLAASVRHKPGRREFVRARVRHNGNGLVAEPLPWQGSAMLRSLTEANAYVVVPEESEGLPAGSQIKVLLREEIL